METVVDSKSNYTMKLDQWMGLAPTHWLISLKNIEIRPTDQSTKKAWNSYPPNYRIQTNETIKKFCFCWTYEMFRGARGYNLTIRAKSKTYELNTSTLVHGHLKKQVDMKQKDLSKQTKTSGFKFLQNDL